MFVQCTWWDENNIIKKNWGLKVILSIGYHENVKRMYKVLAKLGLKQIDRLRVSTQ